LAGAFSERLNYTNSPAIEVSFVYDERKPTAVGDDIIVAEGTSIVPWIVAGQGIASYAISNFLLMHSSHPMGIMHLMWILRLGYDLAHILACVFLLEADSDSLSTSYPG
jgi:hypothetical protein